LILTVIFSAVALLIGQAEPVEPINLQAGQASPETFIASRRVEVVDQAETDTRRAQASAGVADVYRTDTEATEAVLASIGEFFSNVRDAAAPIDSGDDPGAIVPTTSATTTTQEPSEDTTTTTEAPTTTAADDTTTTEGTTTTVQPTTSTTAPLRPSIPSQIAVLRAQHPLLDTGTITMIVQLINDDVDRIQAGTPALFPIVEEETVDIASEILLAGIRSSELAGIRSDLTTDPRPIVLLIGLEPEIRALVEQAVSDIVVQSLQANEFLDEGATAEANVAAENAVTEVTVVFEQGEAILRAGDVVAPVELMAVQDLGLLDTETDDTRVRAMALVAALIVILATLYLWRVGREYWRHPKLVALFGVLMVLAAVASRVPELVARDRVELGFLLPAAFVGYLAANLFDARIAVLMAVPMAAFTALATGDLALVVFAGAATLTPVPLVSSVASRTQLNSAVVVSALIHIPIAAALTWFFYGENASVLLAATWGFLSGLTSGVAALGVLPILSAVFGITTTQALLDLTDRNHPALRLIEDNAPGTFNHSVMVGNLADRAARAVGANPLLARAMAYYHDLGKTTSPKYFIENQFGVTNPHDRLPPDESASIIRSHVAEGLRLSREYRIPPAVAQGILTHHGTSLMRYFSAKAEEMHGEDFEPSDYRHRGRKPKSKEMVILMLADATEAATRALVQSEDPTSEGIRVLVESVITEKVEDGQLEESDVTFGELTRIKEAFVDSLIGYYHTRIPYPGFPAARSAQPA
jgi:hypothetical protein